MAVDLDSLIATESGQQQVLAQDVAKGVASQTKLAQVDALLAELEAVKKRRKALKDSADARVSAAKAKASEAAVKLALVTTMLSTLPGSLKLADLAALVAADLDAPPDPALKTYVKYVDALTTAADAADAAALAAEQAREDEAKALADVESVQAVLDAAVRELVAPADQAAAATAEALQARSLGDFARAYWTKQRAEALVTLVNTPALSTAVTAAKSALDDAIDAFADAKNERLKAEASAASKHAARSRAADQLGSAGAAVLSALLAEVVAAKAQP